MQTKNKTLRQLVEISNEFGKDIHLTIGTSGNTSVKTDDGRDMYIKSSGTALKDMSLKAGWRKINTKKTLAIVKDKSLQKLPRQKLQSSIKKRLLDICEDEFPLSKNGGKAPSTESCFHSLLDKVVIHLHSRDVLGYLCAVNGKEELTNLFKKQGLLPLWIPFAEPGYALATKIDKFRRDYKNKFGTHPTIFFLQNHGFIVTEHTSDKAMSLALHVIEICAKKKKRENPVKQKPPNNEKIKKSKEIITSALRQITGKSVTVKHLFDKKIAQFAASEQAAEICSIPAVTPDELLYANGAPLWLEKIDQAEITEKVKQLNSRGLELPYSVLNKQEGLFVFGENKNLAFIQEVICLYFTVRSFAAGLGGIHPLSQKQRKEIKEIFS